MTLNAMQFTLPKFNVFKKKTRNKQSKKSSLPQ